MTDFDAKFEPYMESLLDSGEQLLGICAASRQQGMFKGGSVALGITDRRLIVQPLTRRGDADGEPLLLTPERVASAKAGGAGGGWITPSAAIADAAAVQLKLKTTDGEKVNLMMMRGEGRVLGKLSGGEGQAKGLLQLGAWFERAGSMD